MLFVLASTKEFIQSGGRWLLEFRGGNPFFGCFSSKLSKMHVLELGESLKQVILVMALRSRGNLHTGRVEQPMGQMEPAEG